MGLGLDWEGVGVAVGLGSGTWLGLGLGLQVSSSRVAQWWHASLSPSPGLNNGCPCSCCVHDAAHTEVSDEREER